MKTSEFCSDEELIEKHKVKENIISNINNCDYHIEDLKLMLELSRDSTRYKIIDSFNFTPVDDGFYNLLLEKHPEYFI